MAHYKESSIAGTQYQRAKVIEIQNPLNGLKGVTFREETMTLIGSEQIGQDCGSLWQPFDTLNATQSFPLLDPVTGVPTGASATFQDVYAMLNSLYFALAANRDAGNGPL